MQEPQNYGCQSCSTVFLENYWVGWHLLFFKLTKHKHLNSDFSSLPHPLLHRSGLVSLLLMSAVPTAWLVDQFSCFVMQLVDRYWHTLHVNHVQVGRVSSDFGPISGTISIDRWGSVCMACPHLTSVLQLGEFFFSSFFGWLSVSFHIELERTGLCSTCLGSHWVCVVKGQTMTWAVYTGNSPESSCRSKHHRKLITTARDHSWK